MFTVYVTFTFVGIHVHQFTLKGLLKSTVHISH